MAQNGPSRLQALKTPAEGLVPSGQCLELKDKGYSPEMKTHSKVISWGNTLQLQKSLLQAFWGWILKQGEEKPLRQCSGICLDNNNRKFAQYYSPHRLTKNKHELKSSVNLLWCTHKRKEQDTLKTLKKIQIIFQVCLGFLTSFSPMFMSL